MRKSHSFLFHETLAFFREKRIQNQKIILGVSGGLDSMTLLSLLQELCPICELELLVSHIHHGNSENKKTEIYRDKAQHLVLQTCEKYKIPVFSIKSEKQLSSEEDFRNFRHQEFHKLLKQKKADKIMLAHNQNDLLETRLINLIRGTGIQGLDSMKAYEALYLRPLIAFSREQIQEYAQIRQLDFLEDPSNKESNYLRNWIRKQWLPDLENKRAGSLKSLARSLEILSNQGKQTGSSDEKSFLASAINSHQSIDRKVFLELSLEEQKRTLAFLLKSLNLPNYGQSHIQELLKHNKRIEKEFKIKLLKKTWLFTENEIKVLPSEIPNTN